MEKKTINAMKKYIKELEKENILLTRKIERMHKEIEDENIIDKAIEQVEEQIFKIIKKNR